jgi:hypothetical protein
LSLRVCVCCAAGCPTGGHGGFRGRRKFFSLLRFAWCRAHSFAGLSRRTWGSSVRCPFHCCACWCGAGRREGGIEEGTYTHAHTHTHTHTQSRRALLPWFVFVVVFFHACLPATVLCQRLARYPARGGEPLCFSFFPRTERVFLARAVSSHPATHCAAERGTTHRHHG